MNPKPPDASHPDSADGAASEATASRRPGGGTDRLARLHHSVFTRLIAVMVTMAIGLLVIVWGFFSLAVGPNLHSSMNAVLRDYTRTLAASSPDLARARDLQSRLGLDVRYAGPAGAWATEPGLPQIADVQRSTNLRQDSGLRRNYYLVAAPDGGTYLFAWTLGSRLRELHTALVVLLLAVITAVVVIAYLVLRRMLAPLRGLSHGVARLGAGELDVTVPLTTRDEFGRLTEAFNQMARRVRGMIGARDQLLLDVSHELRSPLTRMKVALELMPESPDRAGMAADVAEMERMITQLLELERLRSGHGLNATRQDLVPVVREAAAAFEKVPPGVRVFTPAGAVWAEVDEEKVRTVLRNVLENAAKYSLPQSRPIEVALESRRDAVLVRITDDGPGIPEDESERVFEPFFRVDRSRSKNTGGYGLGLSLCKRIMQAHGGDITLERPHRTGASFVLRFPVQG